MAQPNRYVATVKTENSEKDMYFTSKSDLIRFVMERTYEGLKVSWRPINGTPKPANYA